MTVYIVASLCQPGRGPDERSRARNVSTGRMRSARAASQLQRRGPPDGWAEKGSLPVALDQTEQFSARMQELSGGGQAAIEPHRLQLGQGTAPRPAGAPLLENRNQPRHDHRSCLQAAEIHPAL